MDGETNVYCGSCGAALSAGARFCRSCGASQEEFATPPSAPASDTVGPTWGPPAPPPMPPAFDSQPTQAHPQAFAYQPQVTRVPAGRRVAACVAIAGGIGMCFLVLYMLVYVPRHYHLPLAFGEPLQFGDLLTFGSGAAVVLLGALSLRRPPSGGPVWTGVVMMLAGALTVALSVIWAFPEALNLDSLERPFYFGFVYVCELGQVHIGHGFEDGFLQLPLLVCSAAVFLAGVLMAATARDAG